LIVPSIFTALALQTVRALDRIVAGVRGLADALAARAREHAKTTFMCLCL
jgi:adenylosuccinate lyase